MRCPLPCVRRSGTNSNDRFAIGAVARAGTWAGHSSGALNRALAGRDPWHHQRMSQGFGNESPRAHAQTAHRRPARYLLLIDAGGSTVARLFLDTHELVAEFDAGTEEVAQMTHGLAATQDATGAAWDRALEGHSAAERRSAQVYRLSV